MTAPETPHGALDVGRLVATLRPLLVAVHDRGLDRRVTGVVVADPDEPLVASEGDVVLGVGIRTPERVAALVAQAERALAAAVVVKAAPPADGTGVAVLQLAGDAVWLHLAELVRSAVAAVDPLGGDAGLGLFELAEAISALVGGPVTIEDPASHVLAFSGRQDEADEGRIATVLGRRVPEHYRATLETWGVFRALRRSDEPVFVDAIEDHLLPRVAVAVRAGGELLGSIWAAVPERPEPAQLSALRDAARVVALQMLRRRVGADVTRALQADLLGAILAGGERAAEAAERLQLRGPLRLVACRDDGGRGDDAPDRLQDELTFHFRAVHPQVAGAVLGGVVYLAVPDPGPDGRVRRAAQSLVDRAGSGLLVAVTDPVDDVAALPAARIEADRIVRALGLLAGRTGRRLAGPADVRVETLLLRLSDAAAADGGLDDAPLRALRGYDHEHGTDLLRTVAVFLAAVGNVRVAAEELTVHQNTLRYRIARAQAVSGLDLTDPDARFVLEVLLRLDALRG